MSRMKTGAGHLQAMGQWTGQLAGALLRDTGVTPSVEAAGTAPAPSGDLLWWKSSGARPGEPAWIGVSRSGWQSVVDLAGSETPRSAEAAFAALLGETWAGAGEIADAPPAGDDFEVVRIAFADLPPVDLVVALEADAPSAPQRPSLDVLLDIELPLTLRFGRTRMTLDQVVKLDTGSVVEFERQLDEPIELLVNGCVVARGEAVTVQGNYAVRISEIVSRRQRLDSGSMVLEGGKDE